MRRRAFGSAEPKRAQEIAEAINADIIRRGWPVGESLGTQHELKAQYGVSRAVLREAFRLVESRGSAVMRRGSTGGLIVARPAIETTANTLVTYLDIIGVSNEEVLEARLIMESEMIGQAARRLTVEDAQHLRELMSRVRDGGARQGPHIEVRSALARVSGNMVLELFVQALVQLAAVRRSRFARGVQFRDLYAAEFETDAMRAVAAQRQEVELLIAGEVAEAQRILQEDMLTRHDFMETIIRKHGSKDLEQARMAKVHFGHGPFASHLAVEIAEDVARKGLVAGERLGSEPQLMATYGVSRAIFREAVRLLELHGLVYTQRGNRGGLFIGEADPFYAIESAVLSLRSLPLDAKELLEVAQPIALSSVRIALQRQPEFGVVAGPSGAALDASGQSWARLLALEQQILAATGNRVLGLLLSVLISFLPENPLRFLSLDLLKHLDRLRLQLIVSLADKDVVLARRTVMEMLRIFRRAIAGHQTGQESLD